MFKRLFRTIRSWFGALINTSEDPEKILEQNLRDMQDKKVEMNEWIAECKGRVTNLRRKKEEKQEVVNEAESKLKLAIKKDKDEVAKKIAKKRERAKEELARLGDNLEKAEKLLEQAKGTKEQFLREFEEKKREIKSALQKKRQSDMLGETADAMESFEVGSISQTHDEMVRRLEENAAENEARLDMALEDDEITDFEQEAEELKAERIVDEFKKELESGEVEPEKQLEEPELDESEVETDVSPDEVEEDVDKTIGRLEKENA